MTTGGRHVLSSVGLVPSPLCYEEGSCPWVPVQILGCARSLQLPRVQSLQHKFFPRFLTQNEGLGDAQKRSCGGGMVEGVDLSVIDQFSPDSIIFTGSDD